MTKTVLLEICVESVQHAVAAERGGAHRVELCADLSCGGLTPSAELMQAARRQVRIPIHVMIRPRPGDFSYSGEEVETMRRDIVAARQFGMDGIVLGALDPEGHVEVEQTQAMAELGHPLPLTFHRAFDLSENFAEAMEDVIRSGASRILTSGGHSLATDAIPLLSTLVHAARGRIALMPCGGINPGNIARVALQTAAEELHSSVGTSSSAAPRPSDGWSDGSPGIGLSPSLFERRVMQLVDAMRALSPEHPRP
jgi:copper homeostasis protein